MPKDTITERLSSLVIRWDDDLVTALSDIGDWGAERQAGAEMVAGVIGAEDEPLGSPLKWVWLSGQIAATWRQSAGSPPSQPDDGSSLAAGLAGGSAAPASAGIPVGDASAATAPAGSGLSTSPQVRDGVKTNLLVGGAISNAVASLTKIYDIIPVADSAETDQNSEPSLAVNLTDPTQILAGAFGSFTPSGGVDSPYFLSLNGGTTWSDYATLATFDKSLAWSADGSGFLTATIPGTNSPNFDIATYSGTTSSSGFGSPINTFSPAPSDSLDQPWIRTGPSNHVYVAYNNLNLSPATASVNVSTDGGSTYSPIVVDRGSPTSGQDAPSVRLAVKGSTVYAVFTRWNSVVENDANGERFASEVVVVRSDTGGADSFAALGTAGVGSIVGTPTGVFANTENTALTLGQERESSDVAIAVDPNNASHVVVAYTDAPGANGSGKEQLIVAESTNGGAAWSTKFTTDSATRSNQAGLAILANGTIGFLYNNYDPLTNTLSQHLLQTSDDFATTSDTLLGSESNSTPTAVFDPYLGDFFDLEAVGNTFYGIFSASNADNGTAAQFSNVTFQRDFTGTPGAADFQLTDGSNPVAFSIDPFVFVATAACFCLGTKILTERGEIAVEDLAIGDSVVTASGAVRAIRWIGRRAYDGRFITGNREVLPIRIAAGALADGVPARDLWVSPGHCMFIDGVLVQAGHLVNGATIVQAEGVEEVEYFHVELDSHDVIVADGAPTESYVDCDNRLMFANGRDYLRLYPNDERPRWAFCVARLEWGDAKLTLIRTALLARAAALGHPLDVDPDLHLVVDGAVVRACHRTGGIHRFTLPAGCRAVWLASRRTGPAEVVAESRDIRHLGVPVERMVLGDGDQSIGICHSYAAFRVGFHEDEATHRWTDGMARLPEALLRPFAGAFTLEVHLIPSGLAYRPSAKANRRYG